MNLIKFKEDVVLGQDWYNNNLRGRYSYWIRCRYVVPLDSINANMYVSFETTINNLLGINYYALTLVDDVYKYVLLDDRDVSSNMGASIPLVEVVPENPDAESPAYIKTQSNKIKYVDLWDGDYYWMNNYIDHNGTDSANAVDFYKVYNDHVIDGDVVKDDAEKFRTWLAQLLIDVNYEYYKLVNNEWVIFSPSLSEKSESVELQALPEEITEDTPEIVKIKINNPLIDWSDDEMHTLNYYAAGMYDDALKWMSVYSDTQITTSLTNITTNACGCNSGTDISSLYNNTLRVCDPLNIYREGVKREMVNILTDLTMWEKIPSTTLKTISRYLNAIIKLGLIGINDSSSNTYGCDCLKEKSSESLFIQTIKQLIQVFDNLADNEIKGNKNYIISTLNTWAQDYYENMEWN